MENFLFSLNIVAPVFFMMVIGAFLAKIGLFTDDFRSRVTTFVFYIALPASMIRQVAESDLVSDFHPRFVLFLILSTIAVFAFGWWFSALAIRDRSQVSATAHGCFRGNFAYVGLPIIAMLTGKESVPPAVMVVTFVLPLYSVLAVIVLSHYSGQSSEHALKKQVLAILKNPLIIGVLIGLPFSLLRFPIPQPVDTTLAYLGRTASPLGLLLIGSSLKRESLLRKWKGIAAATFVKVVLSPILCTAAALALGFAGDKLAVIYVCHAVPAAVNSYVMTEQMGGDREIGAGIVMVTALVSVVTMAAGIFILRQSGIL